jgi:chemotaxis protein MotA
MDLASLIGIIAGFGIIVIAIFTQEGAGFFLNFPSACIVLGGTSAATFVNFPLSDVLGVVKTAKKAFLHKVIPLQQTLEFLVSIGRQARTEGLLALEQRIREIDDDFLKKGLQLMIDGVDPKLLQEVMGTELYYLEDRHTLGQQIFKTMGIYAPAFGMAGTLIGLIQMLQQLNDPSKIGVGMATALVTTFYGVILANLVFLPIAGKLKTRSQQEMLVKELIILGITSIQAGDNPRLLHEKLTTFLAPTKRQLPGGSGGSDVSGT